MSTPGPPPKASGIQITRQLAKVGVMSLPDRPGVAGAVLGALGGQGISVQFVVEATDLDNRSHIIFCVEEPALPASRAALDAVAEAIGAARVIDQAGLAMVAVYGPHFRERAGCAAAAFQAIASAGVNILAISTSVSSISCLIEEPALDAAVAALARTFEVPAEGVRDNTSGLSRPWRAGQAPPGRPAHGRP